MDAFDFLNIPSPFHHLLFPHDPTKPIGKYIDGKIVLNDYGKQVLGNISCPDIWPVLTDPMPDLIVEK